MTEDTDDPLRRRQYRNPPVVEGIARFQWEKPVAWSFTTPGLLYDRLREVYPAEPWVQAPVSAGVVAPDELTSKGGGLEVRTGPERIIYTNEDGSRRVGVGPIDLSVHGLPPYEGWESMRGRLAVALQRTAAIIGDAPQMSLVGLRYVNRVEIPGEAVDFKDYLTIDIGFPPGFPDKVRAFLDRTEMCYDDSDVTLTFTWASTEATPGSAAFILDLDLYAPCAKPKSVDEAFEVLEDLKTREGRAFEALLTESLRDQFGELE